MAADSREMHAMRADRSRDQSRRTVVERALSSVRPTVLERTERRAQHPIEETRAAFARATALFANGDSRSAQLLLSRQAKEARAIAHAYHPSDPIARVFRAIATNLDVRAGALHTAAPAEARRFAHRLEQVGAATQNRAASLADTRCAVYACTLRSLGDETRNHATLLRLGAGTHDALYGRSLARAFQRIIELAAAATQPNTAISRAPSPASPARSPGAHDLAGAFAELDTLMRDARISFHEAFEELLARAQKRPRAPFARFNEDPLAKKLAGTMLDMSRGLSRGDGSLLNLARIDLLKELRAHRLGGVLEQLRLLVVPAPAAAAVSTTSADLIRSALPDLLLSAFAHGGLGNLVTKDGRIAELLARARAGNNELFLDHPSSFAAIGETMSGVEWPQGQVLEPAGGKILQPESETFGSASVQLGAGGDRSAELPGEEAITQLELPPEVATPSEEEGLTPEELRRLRKRRALEARARNRINAPEHGAHPTHVDDDDDEDPTYDTANENDHRPVFVVLAEPGGPIEVLGSTRYASAKAAIETIEALNRDLPAQHQIEAELYDYCTPALAAALGIDAENAGAMIIYTAAALSAAGFDFVPARLNNPSLTFAQRA